MSWTFNDGGRAAAGFKGEAGDCVTRAISIATQKPYRQVYDDLNKLAKTMKCRRSSARTGIYRDVYEAYLKSLGWRWVSCMSIGTGVKVHLKADELPKGRIICRLSKHVAAVVDGNVHDIYDCTRDGTRAVYGYFTK